MNTNGLKRLTVDELVALKRQFVKGIGTVAVHGREDAGGRIWDIVKTDTELIILYSVQTTKYKIPYSIIYSIIPYFHFTNKKAE